MKKIVFIFGTIAGVITAGMILLTPPSMMEDHGGYAMLIGYTTMIIALSVIFFGIKIYRDKHQGGQIKFGKAFMIGIYISLIASFIYSAGWELSLVMNDVQPMEFMEKYAEGEANALAKEGATAAEVEAHRQQLISSYEWYKNPVLRFLWTMIMEMFLVGIVVSLICAAILRKKEVLPATA